MPRAFVDTGALYALADARDTAHGRAVAFYRTGAFPLLTTSLIFVETMSLLTKRRGKSLALEVGRWMLASERLEIVHVDDALQREAWALFETHADKAWDLVDCVSFTVMRLNGIEEAFGFDRHFAQAGFRLVPGL